MNAPDMKEYLTHFLEGDLSRDDVDLVLSNLSSDYRWSVDLTPENAIQIEIRKLPEWVLTDDDSMQHVKKINADTFSLIEMGLINPDTERYEVYTDTICIKDYPEKEILDIIKVFGYNDFNHLMEVCGDKVNQIVAECIFEHNESFTAEPVFKGTEEDAIRFIQSYIKQN